MFETIYTVQKYKEESEIYAAYFLDYDDAKAFAESEAKKLDDIFSFSKKYLLDGSFNYTWLGINNEITMNDFAWLTDFRFRGLGFYHANGIVTEFETYEDFTNYIIASQNRALS